MVDKRGYLKLTDFGFATRMQNGKIQIKKGKTTASLVGTHEFLAPELLEIKHSYSPASDWWAFGC